MKEARITEETIRILIRNFYAKVLSDKQLKPVFVEAIGEDNDAWEPHLKTMYDFWSSIMLNSGRYKGNPLQKHRVLPPFDSILFNRWLELFAETANELHTEEIANNYIEKSNRIAESLKLGLYFDLTPSTDGRTKPIRSNGG